MLNDKHKYTFFKFFHLFILILLAFVLFSSSTPAQAPPTLDVYMELDYTERIIDTSADISEPLAHVTGNVTLDSRTPMHIEVNLTVNNDWEVTIEPANFTLNVATTGLASKQFTVIVTAPLGIENNTEHTVRVTGTWSYVQEIGGGEIQPKEFRLIARNNTGDNDNNGGSNGDNGDDGDNGNGGMPGFESALLITVILVAVLIFRGKWKRLKK